VCKPADVGGRGLATSKHEQKLCEKTKTREKIISAIKRDYDAWIEENHKLVESVDVHLNEDAQRWEVLVLLKGTTPPTHEQIPRSWLSVEWDICWISQRH
jgi:hypothetical protein